MIWSLYRNHSGTDNVISFHTHINETHQILCELIGSPAIGEDSIDDRDLNLATLLNYDDKFVESSSDEKNDESDAEEQRTSTKKAKTSKSAAKEDPPAKRAKTEVSGTKASVAAASTTGPNGEKRYEVGRMRYISVSEFKNKPYVNIREYYDDKGVEKPGKKGISLSLEQWQKLKTFVDQVDNDLKKY
ncbi:unnamed protein product [Didymodactylos carnosus]|uniref:Transcriptional coactivator p15 (PC4) C-terminal domain-containing protein n=1 Tax=Didymodactylos carnosus TaxID=1234261 RepID=A0A813WBT4_9BILA|nr:unnamed protein product [Didymodactylos carnosus]CAF0901036.1 unnamed protein product [Didymodactylos carnosus]CAF3636150.1 unnamed protein product [Didymodactylos carnosus]CAF3681664.1 unnamed protein product [Didymodactylos carnosus]